MPNLTVGFFVGMTLCLGAHGATLYVGDRALGLDSVRRTNPGLAIKVADAVWWGALYSGTAPAKTLHVGEYWVGQNCAVGAYSTDGVATCTDCGMGHYCTGAMHRETCTYGAIGCPGTRHGTDGALPDGAPINVLMELGDVEKYIPATDITQWRVVSCCNAQGGATTEDPGTINEAHRACANGILGPGTYLFVARYGNDNWLPPGLTDSLDGHAGAISNASIAVFDHPVGYRSVHGAGIFQHFIDTEHAPFETWTISTAPLGGWQKNRNDTNVANIAQQVVYPINSLMVLCVFELQ